MNAPEPTLSVIIPTHKRPEILRMCLEHLEKQTIAKELEVIVVSDGHDDATAALFQLPASNFQLPVRFIEIEKSQQGIARNKGVKEATAPLTLFIGDDIFLAPDACEKHMKAHGTSATAVLGFITWDPAVHITHVMDWLERTGWQFGYPLLKNYKQKMIPTRHQHRFTYTSNISLPTEIAKKIPFREDVTLYGWEDTEWGIRLRDAGVTLFYEPNAKTLHHHHIELSDSLRRMETLGKSIVHLTKINPKLDRTPTGLKLLAYKFLSLFPTMRGKHYNAFLRGMALGSQER